MFLQQLVNGLTLGSLYAVLRYWLNTCVWRFKYHQHGNNGGIFMIGAFVGLFMVTVLTLTFCSPYRSYGCRCYPLVIF